MKKFLNIKTIVGALFLSVIANALWENLFRSFFNFVFKVLLNISTLGFEKYRNNIYINIAEGFYENASIQILALGSGICAGVIFVIMILSFKGDKEDKKIKKNLKFYTWLKHNKKFTGVLFLVYAIFVMGFTVLNLVKTSYVNKSIAYYKQLENIAAPYLTDEQEEMFDSQFAQIKNREDYIKLIKRLSSIIKDEEQTLPKSQLFIF